jgi:hypothetical protein
MRVSGRRIAQSRFRADKGLATVEAPIGSAIGTRATEDGLVMER